jgi:hypothetical protein
MRFFSVLSFSLIGLLLGSDLQARPDRDLRQLIEQRIRQLTNQFISIFTFAL